MSKGVAFSVFCVSMIAILFLNQPQIYPFFLSKPSLKTNLSTNCYFFLV